MVSQWFADMACKEVQVDHPIHCPHTLAGLTPVDGLSNSLNLTDGCQKVHRLHAWLPDVDNMPFALGTLWLRMSIA
jgi:hypothetical protein